MVIDMYKTGFSHPTDLPFEDLSVIDPTVATNSNVVKANTARGTLGGRTKRRAGLRGLFNTAKVSSHVLSQHSSSNAVSNWSELSVLL